MNEPVCQAIDRYLMGDLSDEATKAFEVHLAGCPQCTAEIGLQRKIDHLLREAARGETPPPALAGRLGWRRAMRAVPRVLAVAAAACLLVALSVWQRSSPVEQKQPASPAPDEYAKAADSSRPPVRIRFSHDSSVIALPIESRRPDVSIVWVYPAWNPNSTHDTP